MPLLDDICDYIIQGSLGEFTNANVFAADWQDEPDLALVVYEYPGDNLFSLGNGLPLERPRIQVLVRHPDYTKARDEAQKVRQTLFGINGQTINGTRYLRVAPLDTPHETEPDVQHRKRIAVNYEVVKEPS